MHIYLTRIDPDENMNRWYSVSLQPTLLDELAVIVRWGSRETAAHRMQIFPVRSWNEGEEMAEKIVMGKLKRGYKETP